MAERNRLLGLLLTVLLPSLALGASQTHPACADETGDPPNPFGRVSPPPVDARLGRIELSDGTTIRGRIHLTRDHQLRVYDAEHGRFRNIPLRAVREIRCRVVREWMEREWRFREAASNVKVYTGREYPARQYVHEIVLRSGTTVTGPLAAVVYIDPLESDGKTEGHKASQNLGDRKGTAANLASPDKRLRFVLHKRDKGRPGTRLDQLVYVTRIVLDETDGESP